MWTVLGSSKQSFLFILFFFLQKNAIFKAFNIFMDGYMFVMVHVT